jgi:hypothetical protein
LHEVGLGDLESLGNMAGDEPDLFPSSHLRSEQLFARHLIEHQLPENDDEKVLSNTFAACKPCFLPQVLIQRTNYRLRA